MGCGFRESEGKSKENPAINKQIESYKIETGRHYRNLLESTGFVTAEILKNALRGIGTNQNTLMQEFTVFLEEKKKSIGIRISENTYIQYCKGYRHLNNFLKTELGVSDIPFGKVSIALIEDYVYYLKVDLQMAVRSVNSFLAPFRMTVKRAFNRGMIPQDPFIDYTHEKAIDVRRWLSGEEIERLLKTEISRRPKWIFARDMFLFSTFTGISFVDLKNLEHNNIRQHEDGLWIVLNRKKTQTASCIPLLPVARQVLEKYRNTRFSGIDGKIFRLPTLVNVDWQLKRIARAAGIEQRLTFHMSRHTFATSVCLTNGVPIESLSRMMGHLSIKTTQIYSHVTRTKLNEDMTNLEKRIEGKYRLAENETKSH
jgi:site-specific recombinase XerD